MLLFSGESIHKQPQISEMNVEDIPREFVESLHFKSQIFYFFIFYHLKKGNISVIMSLPKCEIQPIVRTALGLMPAVGGATAEMRITRVAEKIRLKNIKLKTFRRNQYEKINIRCVVGFDDS